MQKFHQVITFHAKGLFSINYASLLQVEWRKIQQFQWITIMKFPFQNSQLINGILTFNMFFIQFSPMYKICYVAGECQQKWARRWF